MNQLQTWPPPAWTECVITWSVILANSDHAPNDIMIWLAEYPSKYRFHLHGYKQTEGFAFRFENARDATVFQLRWA